MEMLIVVIIAAAVAVMAVPSYNKTRDRVRYDEAKGLLIDLGMAVQSLQGDLAVKGKVYPSANISFTSSYQNDDLSSYEGVATVDLNNDTLWTKALFAREYMPKVQFDSGGSTYHQYSFTICKEGSTSGCCNASTVVCMSGGSEKYQGARYLTDTSIALIGNE